jgi:hypothetical protein
LAGDDEVVSLGSIDLDVRKRALGQEHLDELDFFAGGRSRVDSNSVWRGGQRG